MVGRKMPTESKRCKKTTATFLKAFEDSFFSEKIIPLFSHFFRPSCRCPQNDLRMLMTFAGFQGRTPTTSVLEKRETNPHPMPLPNFTKSQFICPHRLPGSRLILLQPRARCRLHLSGESLTLSQTFCEKWHRYPISS